MSRLEVENNELSRKLEKLRNSMDEQARLHNSQVMKVMRIMMMVMVIMMIMLLAKLRNSMDEQARLHNSQV